MNILLIGAGCSYSTKDVEDGYHNALIRAGQSVIYYDLDGRIDVAGKHLGLLFQHYSKGNPELQKPSWGDIVYAASVHAIEKALWTQPDWILVASGMFLPKRTLVLLRRAGFKVAVILTESPYDIEYEKMYIEESDVVFTNERTSVNELREVQPKTYYLGHAFDQTLLPSISDDVEKHDVVFVGTGFQERCETLRGVNWNGIGFGLYGQWPLLGSRDRLRKHIRGGVTKHDTTLSLYSKAAIGLNLYRTTVGDISRNAPRIEHAESLNPRAIELAALGCFTISDSREEVKEVFGSLVPTFTCARELEQLIRFYLAYPMERMVLASILPSKVAQFTYDARTRRLLGVLESA